MDKILIKIASELDRVADFLQKVGEEVEKKEDEAKTEEKKKEDDTKEEEEKKEASKREDLIAPIREALSKIADDGEVVSRLNATPTETLELLKRGFEEKTVTDGWGSIEENRSTVGGRGKQAGYRDPIEAFAMGD